MATIDRAREAPSHDASLYFIALEKLCLAFPTWPWSMARLASAHLFLEDIDGALDLFEKTQELMSSHPDPVLDSYVSELQRAVAVSLVHM